MPVKIGDLHDAAVLLAIGGFVDHRRAAARGACRGAILIGIAVTAIAGYLLGVGERAARRRRAAVHRRLRLAPIALQLDIAGVLRLSFLPILLTLFLMSFLDTLGTLVGVGAAGGMLDEHGNFPQIERPMLVDALSCMFSGLVGTSTSGAYIESAAGIREGARTGLAAVVTGGCSSRLSLFFIPLVEPLQTLSYRLRPGADRRRRADARRRCAKIDFDDLTELGAGVRHDRDDGLHLQHRQRPDRGAGAVSADEAAGGTGARDQRGVGGAGGALPGVLRVRVAALKLLLQLLLVAAAAVGALRAHRWTAVPSFVVPAVAPTNEPPLLAGELLPSSATTLSTRATLAELANGDLLAA